MKRLSHVVLLVLVSANFVSAQGLQKLNLQLSKLVSDPQHREAQISILLKGDLETIYQITNANSGVVKYTVADMASVIVPVFSLEAFAESAKISRIESPMNNYKSMNDSIRSVIHANEVHAGISPLPQGYDGSNVVIGIIDTGVDLTHPDLTTASGTTRVKHLWDQRKPVAANTPPAFGYGQEWNNTEIDAGLAVSSNDVQGFGHGTHVSGIAAGDGSANGKNKGVAPGADIIEVAFDFNNTTNSTYLDAVNYIFTKATAMGKPCVINASLGDYYGSHDGYDLQSQMVSAMLNQQSGRVLVAAAGNAGSIPFHLGYTANSDTAFSWVRHNPAYTNTYFQIWGDTADFKNIQFSIGADANTTTASFRGKLNFRNIFYNLGVFKQDTLFSTSGNRLAIIQSFGSTQGPTYLLEFNIIPDSTTYFWRLMTTGSGKLDIWKFYDGTGQPGFVNSGLPTSAIVPEIVYYKLPDANSTIVSGIQCLDNVITVANYGNRNSYVDFNGNTQTDANVTPGQIISNSSWGPTRDGRIKPDIAAPGSLTLSCGQLSLMAIWQGQPNNVIKIAEGGYHFRDGGTSSASPVVAGIAALYLQKNPTANAVQVKNAIMQCAVQDAATGTNLPNNIWGAGKADAFNTLVNCSLTSLTEISSGSIALSVYPNPIRSGEDVNIHINSNSIFNNLKVQITDIAGRTISYQNLNSKNALSISTNGIDSGVYFINIFDGKKLLKTEKISILK